MSHIPGQFTRDVVRVLQRCVAELDNIPESIRQFVEENNGSEVDVSTLLDIFNHS